MKAVVYCAGVLVGLLAFFHAANSFMNYDDDECIKLCKVPTNGSCDSMSTEVEYYGCHKYVEDNNSTIGVGFSVYDVKLSNYNCTPNVTLKGLITRSQYLTAPQICCLFEEKIRDITKFVAPIFKSLSPEQMSGVVDILYSNGLQAISSKEFQTFFRFVQEGKMISAVEDLKKTEWCKAYPARCSRDANCIDGT